MNVIMTKHKIVYHQNEITFIHNIKYVVCKFSEEEFIRCV